MSNLKLKCRWPSQNSVETSTSITTTNSSNIYAGSNDFIVLEYFLHQSVKLRLNEPSNDNYSGLLKEAHEISTIISRKTGNF